MMRFSQLVGSCFLDSSTWEAGRERAGIEHVGEWVFSPALDTPVTSLNFFKNSLTMMRFSQLVGSFLDSTTWEEGKKRARVEHVEVLEGVELPYVREGHDEELVFCGREVIVLLDSLGLFPWICLRQHFIFVFLQKQDFCNNHIS